MTKPWRIARQKDSGYRLGFYEAVFEIHVHVDDGTALIYLQSMEDGNRAHHNGYKQKRVIRQIINRWFHTTR